MLKNYTSSVPASRSVLHIEDCLALNGAQSVVKQYDKEKQLQAVSFFMEVTGRLTPFRLPARIDQVEKVLRASVKRPRRGTLEKIKDQAVRTAWKIISDWVDAQMALVELQQAEIMAQTIGVSNVGKRERLLYNVGDNPAGPGWRNKGGQMWWIIGFSIIAVVLGFLTTPGPILRGEKPFKS